MALFKAVIVPRTLVLEIEAPDASRAEREALAVLRTDYHLEALTVTVTPK